MRLTAVVIDWRGDSVKKGSPLTIVLQLPRQEHEGNNKRFGCFRSKERLDSEDVFEVQVT